MVKSLILFMTMLLWQTGIAQEAYNGMKVQREKDGVYLVADGDKIKVCDMLAMALSMLVLPFRR